MGADREATFVCSLCVYFSPEEIFFFYGQLKGTISDQLLGKEGFGYDSVFIPKGDHGGQTLAQISSWKQNNSHRFVASKHAENFLKNYQHK